MTVALAVLELLVLGTVTVELVCLLSSERSNKRNANPPCRVQVFLLR